MDTATQEKGRLMFGDPELTYWLVRTRYGHIDVPYWLLAAFWLRLVLTEPSTPALIFGGVVVAARFGVFLFEHKKNKHWDTLTPSEGLNLLSLLAKLKLTTTIGLLACLGLHMWEMIARA